MRLSVFSVYRAPKKLLFLLISSIHVIFWLVLINVDFMPVLFLIDNDLKNQFITCKTKISDLEYKNHLLIRLTDKIFEYGTWSYLESYPTQCKLFYFMLNTQRIHRYFLFLMIITSSEIWYTYQFCSALCVPYVHSLSAVTHFVFVCLFVFANKRCSWGQLT